MKSFHRLGVLLLLATSLTAHAQQPPAPNNERPPMTDEQRAQLEERLNNEWRAMPLEGKVRVMRLHRATHEMAPEDRKFIHDRVERYLNMPPEERERLKQNRQKWEGMTPEQRQQAREKFQQRRKEFEENWRRDHPGEEPPPFPFHHPKPAPPAAGHTPQSPE